MDFENNFGEIIRKLRLDKELPLRQVAEALGIDTSMLAKIEKNSRKPTKLFIEKFAIFFDVSSKDLMIAFLSDTVVYQVMHEENYASEVLKVAEDKVQYLKNEKTS